jgi:hypothetical protein
LRSPHFEQIRMSAWGSRVHVSEIPALPNKTQLLGHD